MTVKKGLLFLLMMISTWLNSQNQIKYYRLENVITIQGVIQKIQIEECYRKKNFMVIYINEKQQKRNYRIEVSPKWFFGIELMKGNLIEVTGSHSVLKDSHLILAKSITFQGQIHYFRDKYGFPLWQGKGKYSKYRNQGMKRRKGRR